MPFDSLINRTDAQATVPEQVSNEMLTSLSESSAALALGTQVPVASNQTRFPVLSALPAAQWVSGDTGLKQTTEAAWANKFLNIEELAAIVPIPENVIDDAGFDLFGAIRPLLEGAISRSLDSAIFFGTDAPASFPDDIVTSAVAAGNVVARGANNAAAGGIAGDLSDLVGTLEADGYFPTGAVANATVRGRIRQNRATTGENLGEISPDSFYGAQAQYPMAGLWPSGVSVAEVIAGQFSNLVIGVRRDITYKLITEGVITDADGNIVFNLPQQDMVALRVTFRAGWEVSNPVNRQQPTEASRYPFAVLRSPAS